MNIKIEKKDVIYFVVMLIAILTTALLNSNRSNRYKEQIEKRLKEVCFAYNKNCDDDVGGCVCEVKASKADINYILNK